MDQKGFINIIIIVGLIILAGAAGYFIGNQTLSPTPISPPSPMPTPSPEPDEVQILLREGQRESSLLVEKIYSDHITGLNFGEYPIPFERGLPITLRIGETASNGCTITLTLVSIEGNAATFIRKTDFNRPCPICLAVNTLIDTPLGAVPIQQLQKGISVWTTNKSGERVAGVVIKTSRAPVAIDHQMVQLILDDGRKLLVSPGHPIVDGRTVGSLIANDPYDGARVVSFERVTYDDVATYDILPSGETGFYWANGILLDSTLH